MEANRLVDMENWLVTLSYTQEDIASAGAPPPTKPWMEKPQIRFSFAQYSEVARKAYALDDGVTNPGTLALPVNATEENPTIPIDNSFHDPFDPPVMVDKNRTVIIIQRNELLASSAALQAVLSRHASLNKDIVTVASFTLAPYQGKMQNISLTRAYYQGQRYFEIEYQIEINRQGHTSNILDAGWYYGIGTVGSGVRYKFADAEGNPYSIPGKLDGSGHELAPNGTPVYRRFLVNWPIEWQPLGLPGDAT
jgi:hypothetical protein